MNIGKWCLSPLQSRHLGTSHSSLIFVDCSPYMFNILRCSACCRPSSTWTTFNRFSTIFEAFVPHFYCVTLIASPTKALWITQIISTKEHLSLMQNSMQICCSTRSVSLNAMATQYTCFLNGVNCPHWPVPWSRHCWHIHIPVYSPWLPGYIDVVQTILFIVTVAGFFQTHIV